MAGVPAAPASGRFQARALALQARREVEELCYGTGWDVEYSPRHLAAAQPRDHRAARARVLRRDPQDWLRELAKRHARWQLAGGLSSGEVAGGARAVARKLGVFLDSAGIPSPAAVSREVLERFLASLTVLPAAHRYKVIETQHVPAGRPPARLEETGSRPVP